MPTDPAAERPLSTPTSEEISEYMPLVQRIVAHFMRRLPRSVQREDLVAAGTLGLFNALRSSSHTCPAMFASYARIRIRGSIVDELRRHDWSPRRRREPVSQEQAAVNGAATNPGTAVPSDAGNAAIPAVRPRVAVVSFDDLPAGSAASLADYCASPLDDVLARREHEALHAAVELLPEREREIVEMRYFQGLPSKAIARAMGLSEARISQLHARATARLKDFLGDAAEDLKFAA